jgi:hypothetical protein
MIIYVLSAAIIIGAWLYVKIDEWVTRRNLRDLDAWLARRNHPPITKINRRPYDPGNER